MKGSVDALPVGAGLAAIAMLTGLDAAVKHLGATYPVGQVVAMRFLAGTLMVAAVVAATRGPWPTRAGFRRAAVRAVAILATSLLFYKTLTLLPFAEAVAVTFVSPFLMLLLSRVMLGEPVTGKAVAAMAVGFAGLLVMLGASLGDVGGGDPLGYATGLGAAATYALATVLTRRDVGTDPVVALVLAQNVAVSALSLPFGLAAWTMPDLGGLAFVALAAALGTAGHLVLTWAYSRAPATRLAPLEYSTFVWAAGLGWLLFAEVPGPSTVAGAAMIAAGCLVAAGRGRPPANGIGPDGP